MTPLPARTRVVTARIEDTTSRDSNPLLISGMKIRVTLLFLSRTVEISPISLGENTPGRSANAIFSELKGSVLRL